MSTKEHERLREIDGDIEGWRKWGPYLSERSWATVREDYSPDGEAWNFLPHDLARSKAYRWGEDGIAGICDRYQLLCFAPAFWNGQDAILKERLFGLTPFEGNHGEDVKEYYFHLDNLPTHSYMKYLYKYPQTAFPYADLVAENRRRQGQGFEYELLESGAFHENRYFDIFIEYAKVDAEDICIRIEAFNRAPDPAPLHILPHLWFRNTWLNKPQMRPTIRTGTCGEGFCSLTSSEAIIDPHSKIPSNYRLESRALYAAGARMLFTENETNPGRVPSSAPAGVERYYKDAFHRYLIDRESCVNMQEHGSKAALHYHFPAIAPGESAVVRLRLTPQLKLSAPLDDVDKIVMQRRAEADDFYHSVHPAKATEDERRVQRQALSGLLWTKQSYLFDVSLWLEGDPGMPKPPASRRLVRNQHWRHLNSMRIMTVPDKWEYPWFAAWDLAFHCVAFALIDPQYAKDQLWVMLFEQFQHPNGQIPAYEWDFSDLNPPVHAWAVWRVFNIERQRYGRVDRMFLEQCFHKLMLNFTWWINRVDREGNNIFEGGFLGLDNIAVLDRSVPSLDGTVLEQADGTGWMGMFCLNMLRIALELAKENQAYENLAVKFFQHYAYIAAAMKHMGNRGYQLWDDRDGFFYDVLRFPDGRFQKFRVRSMVGLIPLFAVERLESRWMDPLPEFNKNVRWFMSHRQDLVRDVIHPVKRDGGESLMLTIVNQNQLTRLLQWIWSEPDFLSPFGVRSLSKQHLQRPFLFDNRSVGYEPAEAESKIKGGNSNWRGPIWFPTNYLLIESFRKLGQVFGPDYKVALPGGKRLNFHEMAREMAHRLISIFCQDPSGRRPVFGGTTKFQEDPHWRDYLQFYEYFHGDNGAGLGASHQTGWTALVANLMDEWL